MTQPETNTRETIAISEAEGYYFLHKPRTFYWTSSEWEILEFSEEEYGADSVQQRAIALLEAEDMEVEFVDFRLTRDDSLKYRDIRVVRAKDVSQFLLGDRSISCKPKIQIT